MIIEGITTPHPPKKKTYSHNGGAKITKKLFSHPPHQKTCNINSDKAKFFSNIATVK